MRCVRHVLQRKRDALKDAVRGHVALKVQAIQELESTLELQDLGTEGWNVQLFRSIDSSKQRAATHVKDDSHCLTQLMPN